MVSWSPVLQRRPRISPGRSHGTRCPSFGSLKAVGKSFARRGSAQPIGNRSKVLPHECVRNCSTCASTCGLTRSSSRIILAFGGRSGNVAELRRINVRRRKEVSDETLVLRLGCRVGSGLGSPRRRGAGGQQFGRSSPPRRPSEAGGVEAGRVGAAV